MSASDIGRMTFKMDFMWHGKKFRLKLTDGVFCTQLSEQPAQLKCLTAVNVVHLSISKH